MLKAVDCKGPLKVGRRYWVECVCTGGFYIPLFGPVHSDGPETGALPDQVYRRHIHFDMRFVTDKELERMKIWSWQLIVYNLNVTETHPCTRWEARKCLRQWDNMSPPDSPERKQFEKNYSKCQIDLANPVCPHQKFDLKTIEPREINGHKVIICPGHLLGWCAKTGNLVPRNKVREYPND